MQKDNGRFGKKRERPSDDGARRRHRGLGPSRAPPRRWRSGEDDHFEMEDLSHPETMARFSLYLGIFALVTSITSVVLKMVPGGDCLICLIWPILGLGALAVLGGIGTGVAASLMEARNKGETVMGIVLSGLSVAVYIIGNVIVSVLFL